MSDAHLLELEGGIAQTRGDARLEGLLEQVHLGTAEHHLERRDVLFEVFATLGARDRHDVLSLCKKPSQRDLRRRAALRFSEALDRVEKSEISLEIALLKARMI